MDTVIKNVNIADPFGKHLQMDIGIEDGRIISITEDLGDAAEIPEAIDARGLWALPAFADMHCHLRDPGYTHKEDLITGSRSAAAGGYTDICCMPNTNPPLDSAALIRDVIRRSEKAAVRVHPVGCVTRGMKGQRLTDFAHLRRAGAIAFSDDGFPIAKMEVMIEAMEQALETDSILMVHEEDLVMRGSGVAHAGPAALRAGLEGIPRSAEDSMVSRDLYIARTNGGRLHFCHVSTQGAIRMIAEQKKEKLGNITCETAPHYFSLTDSEVASRDARMKVNPPLREESDRIAVIEGLRDGTIDAIATDHAPHSDEEKARSFEDAPFGMIGFETAFPAAITHLYRPGILPLFRIAELMSTNPRRILGLPGGKLEPGEPADIVLCDVDTPYTYSRADIVSKAHNSPFIGRRLYGRVMKTILGGRVIYDRSADTADSEEG